MPFAAILTIVIVVSGCNQKKQMADIPDIQSVYDNIGYLDTLIRSEQIDSIEKINDQISATLLTYASRAQTPEDNVMLDSLSRINSVTADFLRFCYDNRTNLEMLQQDTKTLETQYKSGKIKITTYVSELLEEEEVLIDINDQLTSKYETALQYLKSQSLLISRLSPLQEQ